MSDVSKTGQSGQTQSTSSSYDSSAITGAEKSTKEYTEKTGSSGENGTADMAYYLQLQEKMMKEQQAYTALTNVMKARSDSALTAIRNVK